MFGGIFGRASSSSSSNQFGQVEDGVLTVQLSSGTKWEILKMKDVGHRDIAFEDPAVGKRRKGKSTVIKVSDDSSTNVLVDYMNKNDFPLPGVWWYFCVTRGYLSLYKFADSHNIPELKTLVYDAFEYWVEGHGRDFELINQVLKASGDGNYGGFNLPGRMRALMIAKMAEILNDITDPDIPEKRQVEYLLSRKFLRPDLIRAVRLAAMSESEMSDVQLPN